MNKLVSDSITHHLYEGRPPEEIAKDFGISAVEAKDLRKEISAMVDDVTISPEEFHMRCHEIDQFYNFLPS